MTILRFFGGVGEIGGNKTLLKDEDTRIFLDFGKSYGKEKRYYDPPYLKPRAEKHLLNLGLLPDLKGLYKDDMEPTVDGIFISHPHMDHWGYAHFLDDQIPLYCGEGAKNIILNYEYCSRLAPLKKYYIGNLTKKGRKIFKDFHTFENNEDTKIGSLTVNSLHVDHSIPAAYGFIVHTSSGSIAYTGDFRLHGPKSDMSREFISKVAQVEPDILITEATNLTRAGLASEQSVRRRITQIIGQASGLVLIAFSSRDFDRLKTIYEATKANKRKLALPIKQAFQLKELEDCPPHLDMPKITNKNVIVYSKEKSRREAYEKEVFNEVEVYSTPELQSIQKDVVLVTSYFHMHELMEIDPQPSSVFILSKSEPFDEEGEIQHEKLLHWCEFFGLPLYQVHASGHIMPYDLKAAIKEMNPKTTIPIHTENPLLFKHFISDLESEVKIPEFKKSVQI